MPPKIKAPETSSKAPCMSQNIIIGGLLLLVVVLIIVVVMLYSDGEEDIPDDQGGNGHLNPNENRNSSTITITRLSSSGNRVDGPPCLGGLSQPGCSLEGGPGVPSNNSPTNDTNREDCPHRFIEDSRSETGFLQCIWNTNTNTCDAPFKGDGDLDQFETGVECSPDSVDDTIPCAIPYNETPLRSPWMGGSSAPTGPLDPSSPAADAMKEAIRVSQQQKCVCPATHPLTDNADNNFNWRCSNLEGSMIHS